MASAYVSLLSLNSSIEQNPAIFDVEHFKEISTTLLRFFEDYHDSKVCLADILHLEMRTKEVAMEASRAIDFIAMDQMLMKHGHGGDNSTRLFSPEDVDRMVEEFESIKEEALKVMTDIRFPAAAPTERSYTGPSRHADNSTMVGFDKHLFAVMGQLLGHESTLQILPIVGMGGIGKTTVAQNILDTKLVKDHFRIRLWSTISQSYKVQHVLSSFLHELNILDGVLSSSMRGLKIDVKDQISSINNSNPLSINVLGDKLYKFLFGRRYLIVLDDIWSIELWDTIGRFFPKNDNGSRIIITSRRLDVAHYIGSYDPYKLEYLDEDESWNLLKEKVFALDKCPSILMDVGRRIAVSCQGLPLAIVVIAGHLTKSDMTKESWEDVARALITILHSENDNQCLKILSLSYDNLPIYLKPCFLYMAFFREGYEFRVSKMIKCWAADGLVKPITDQCLEDTAMEYLTDLVERNLISVSKQGSTGKIKCFRIHDLVHDLCTQKSLEHKFFDIAENDHTPGKETKPNGLHKIPKSNFSRISSFDLSSSDWANKWANQDAYFNLWFFRLRSIKLTYSQATNSSSFSAALATTSMFQNLQTLGIEETPGNEPLDLPPEIWEMSVLRHLLIKQVVLPDPPTDEACDVTGKEGCVLVNLQTLRDVYRFKLSDEVIRRIPNLKKLKMTCTKVSDDSTVQWQHYSLYNLSHLCKLESLNLSVCNIVLPADISFPQSLRKLTLDGCKFPWKAITMVGSLPNLEVLRLQNDAFYSREWKPAEGEFCQLKVLHLRNMSLQQWEADSSHFPRLEKLILHNVWRLKEIPQDIGNIATLQFISIEHGRFSLYSSVEQLIEEQKSMENNCIQVDLKRNISFQNYHREVFGLLNLNSDDMGVMVEKFEEELCELYAFIRYTARKHRNEMLKELSKQIQDILYEHVDIFFTIGKQLNQLFESVDCYHMRRFLSLVKEVEYVSLKVRRILLADEENHHQGSSLYNDPPTPSILEVDNEGFTNRMRHMINNHMMDMDPDWLKKNPDWAKYVEPPISNSRVQFVFPHFALLTPIDGISKEEELENSLVHTGIRCDYRHMKPIGGVRYMICKECVKEGRFDLCKDCRKHSVSLQR